MNNEEWDKQVGHPMQAWAWGEFREKMGNRVSRVTGDSQYQIIWSKLYWLPVWFGYVPMGPCPTQGDLDLLRQEAVKNSAIGIRMEPNVRRGELSNFQFSIFNQFLKPGRKLFKPKTFWVDLTKSEEEMLALMHPKARYNIRLAMKHGVTVKEDAVGLSDYVRLMFGKTTKRQKIYAHTEKYHRQLAKQDFVRLFSAEYHGKPIAAWMVFVWKDSAYYAYGAFDDQYRQVMAPVLGLWEIIKWAKTHGYKQLDLWGAEEGRGFSRFKEQFGPREVEMVGTWDLPVNLWGYRLFRMAEEVRWKILRRWK